MTYRNVLDTYTCILLALAFWVVWTWNWFVADTILILMYKVVQEIDTVDIERPDLMGNTYVYRFFLWGAPILLAVVFKFIDLFTTDAYMMALAAFALAFMWILMAGEYVSWWDRTHALRMSEFIT